MPTTRMTPRARAYMTICALRHLLRGLMCVARPRDFTSPTYIGIKSVLPLPPDTTLVTWGTVFITVAILATYAGIVGSEITARHALTASVAITFMWIGALIWSIITDQSTEWSGTIVWAALAAKDLTMLRDPLRNPFEDLIARPGPARARG